MNEEEVGALTGAQTLRQLLAWRFPGPKVREMFDGVLRDAVAASQDADALVFHPFISIASDIAEARGIPAVLVPLAMISPSAESPLAMLPRPKSALWNRLGYSLIYMQRPAFQRTINEIRKTSLGMGRSFRFKHPHKVRGERVPVIYPVSAALHPEPERHADIHFTGYWFRDDEPEWHPPRPLAEFLAAGPRPIYVGFGSMPSLGRDRATMLFTACKNAGQRVVLGKGWGSLQSLADGLSPDNFFFVDYAPHAGLFREVSAVVHHGGLGTTSSGLMAGRPTLICPMMLDQAYWGHRVAVIGAGPEPVPVGEWTLPRLTAAIRDVATNEDYRKAAADVQVRMREDGGAPAAARIIRGIIGHAGARAA